MTTPRCPFCNASGLDQLAAQTVGFFAIIYCRNCGAIHGVVSKPPREQPKPVEAPHEPATPQIQPEPKQSPPEIPPEPFDIRKIKVEPEPEITPERARAMMPFFVQPGSTRYRIIRKDDEEE